MAQANKHSLSRAKSGIVMAALTYNLKKYLNFPTKLRKIGANMLEKVVNQLQNGQNIGVDWLIFGI